MENVNELLPVIEENKIVLICDDSIFTLHSMERGLKKYYNIITTTSGYDALNKINLYHPDIILLDLNMAGLTGFDVIKEIKSRGNTKYIPIIVITGVENDKCKSIALEMGIAEYFEKPVNLEILIETIEKHIN